MIRWIPYVFVRVILFFSGGILLGIYQPDFLSEFFTRLIFGLLLSLYFFVFFLRGKLKINAGFIGLIVIFLAGYIHVLNQTDSRSADHFIHLQKPIAFYEAVITKSAEEKDRSWKLETEVRSVKAEGEWRKYDGKIMLYFSKNDFALPYHYGDVLLVKGNPQLVPPPSNPGEFDYQRFLSFRKIYHQQFLRANDVVFVEHDPPSHVMEYAFKARAWADATLKKYVRGEREQAIASALVLGVTDGLDNELLNAYAGTGAMHVLSVSGLHVSIIYFIVLIIFKPLNKMKSGKWILAVISLFILWSYAFVTGLSPSVLRAVVMFTFVALARPWGQSTNIYNTLAASAFCLLLYEPYLIMSVGFQLSYLAVLGIVYLQPSLYRLWEPNGRFWDEVWKITTVSIAAQIATFSLGLLYFHQFPNYFLFSNLFVIPISFAVLVLGLAVLVFSIVHPVALALGFLLELTIKVMNFAVFTVESLPFSLVENIYLTTFQCWLLIGMVILLIVFVEHKRFSYLFAIGSLALIYAFAQWFHFTEDVNKQRITVYRVPGHSALELADRGQAYFFTDSILYRDKQKIRFHIQPNRLICGISEVKAGDDGEMILKFSGCSLIVWRDKYILRIEKKEFNVPDQLSVDYLVIGNNAISDLSSVSQKLKFRKLILDSSNSFYLADKILKQADEQKVDVYSVLHQGAFTITI